MKTKNFRKKTPEIWRSLQKLHALDVNGKPCMKVLGQGSSQASPGPCYGQQWTRERGSGQSPQAEAGPSPVPVSFLLSPSVTSSLTLVHTCVTTSPTEWRVCVAGEREPAHWDTNLNTIERGSWREGDRWTDRCALASDCRGTFMILKLVSL